MTAFFEILVLLNTLVLAYLVFIIYTRNKSKPQKEPRNTSNHSTKITLTRFNPFDDIGGDQSFILCLLDNSDSGAIITSLHNRDLTRVYAKTIKNGQPLNSALSKEEKTALIKTINS
jgi:hypothetical protein